ncbi:hypothetical protein NUW58_g5362 [Xylaria curta]|uniref:Uncharacterized protein n=1 Tax=Xylaria curta TaxID=42375 RepID=A0ACC1P212_9PEZI|nr:hypothetical protein NUW58_g5362 [Xylaria curta]
MLFSSFLCACAVSGALGASWIAPGAVWYDTDGNKIDAHGGGVVLRGDTYYWVGHASSNQTPMMYSSTDLLNWKNLGKQASSVSGMWRPKIAKPNGSFWLFGQQDRYVLSLKSGQFIGGYGTSAKVHIPPNDYSYSDTGMFYDDATDTWYLLTSADHNIVQINRINSDGKLGDKVSDLRAGAYEAPGIVKADGNTFELTIKGSQKTTHIYMGDAWDSKGGASSNYVWAPMNINAGAKTVQIDYHSMWKVDVKTGAVTYPSALKRYEANLPILSGREASNEPNEVTFHNVTGTGSLQWLAIHYQVKDPEASEAYIIVNDEPAVNISSLNSRAGYHDSTPVQLKLRSGDVNTITLGISGEDNYKIAANALEIFEED